MNPVLASLYVSEDPFCGVVLLEKDPRKKTWLQTLSLFRCESTHLI